MKTVKVSLEGSKAPTGSDRRFKVDLATDRLWVAIDWVTGRFIRATSLVGLMYSQAIITLFKKLNRRVMLM